MSRVFKVGKSRALLLGYDSDVHAPTPRRFKEHKSGAVLTLDSEAPNGNVWFIDADGERGKTECGEVRNLTKDGRLVELQP